MQKNPCLKIIIPSQAFSGNHGYSLCVIFLSKLADRQYILISLLGAPLLAFLLAYFTKDRSGDAYNFSENENLPAYMFMCVITASLYGTYNQRRGDRKGP